MRRFALLAVVVVIPQIAASQSTPIGDLVGRSQRALNDLRYREADSLARRVLAFGDLATRPERIAALQVVVAAAYPEETGAQKFDTTLAYIRKLVDLGATQLPRDLTHPSLDTLFALVVSRAKAAPNNRASTQQAGGPLQPQENVASPDPVRRRSMRPGLALMTARIQMNDDEPASGFALGVRMDGRRQSRLGYRSEFSVSRAVAKETGFGPGPFYVVLAAHVAMMANGKRAYGAVGPTYALVRAGRITTTDANMARLGAEMTGGIWATQSQKWAVEGRFHNIFMSPGASKVMSLGLVFSP